MQEPKSKPLDAVSFYEWSLQDAKREVISNFKILRTIKNFYTYILLIVSEELSQGDQLLMIRAHMNLSHKDAVQALGLVENKEEESMFELLKARRFANVELYNKSNTAVWDEYKWKLNKTKTAAFLLTKLHEVLPGKVRKLGSDRWRTTTVYEDRFIHTDINIDASRRNIDFYHCMCKDPEYEFGTPGRYAGPFVTGKLDWLGFGSTSWYISRENEIEAVGDSMISCAKQYLEGAQHMLPKKED